MKAHTQTFKDNLITLGKEIDAKVTYSINGVETELDGDTLGSVTPHYEGNILKSVMKQVDIVSDVDIPLNTEINVQFGMRYDTDEYEYVDYGNYIVFSSEKQEDTNNYKIIAYDKMLYAMKDYESLFDSNLYNGTLEQGTISSTGELNDATYRVRSVDYLEVEPSTEYTLSTTSNVQCFVFQYQEDETFVSRIPSSWTTFPYTFTTGNNINKLKFAFRKSNDADITPEEVENIVLKKGTADTIIYPVTINQYIQELCNKIGLEFANSNEIYCNYDKEITQELYSNLGYTYRDVLDQLAQVTASTICINKDDKLEIRYLNDSINESEEVEGQEIEITNNDSDVVKIDKLEGKIEQETTILPSDYTQVEYIESSGTQYIDTGYVYKQNDNVIIDFMPLEWYVDKALFGQYELGKVCEFGFLGENLRGNIGTSGPAYTQNTRYVVEEKNGLWYYNGTSFGVTYNVDTTNNCYLFCRNYNGANKHSKVRVYDLTIKRNNNIILKFIPCYRNSDNVVGMYEIINNQFYTNQGTGTFTKGTNSILPNPNYPTNINIVTGRQEVEIIGSKNLFDEKHYNNDNLYQNNVYRYTLTNIRNKQLYTKVTLKEGKTGVSGLYLCLCSNVQPNIAGSKFVWLVYNGTKASYSFNATDIDNLYFSYYPTSINVNDIFDNYNIMISTDNVNYEPYNGKLYEINLGKNLLYNENAPITYNGVQVTYNNGIFGLNGTAEIARNGYIIPYSKSILHLKKGESVTFYIERVSGTSKVSFLTYFTPDDGSTQSFDWGVTLNENTSSNKVVKTATKDGVINYVQFFLNANYTYDSEVKILVQKGNIASPVWSEYFTPIELGKISTYQDKIERSKNLLNYKNIDIGIGTITPITDGWKLDSSDTQYDECEGMIPITLTPGKKYYASFKASNITSSFVAMELYKKVNGAWTYVTSASATSDGTYKFNFIAPSEETRISLYLEEGTAEATELYVGELDASYVPYGEVGEWYLHKEIGKVVLNGSESWNVYGTGTPSYFYYGYIAGLAPKTSDLGFSNYFNVGNIGSTGTNQGVAPITNYVRVRYGVEDTTDNFKTWLSTHNTEVYYVLATPTTTEITKDNYPELLSQLKALEKMKLLDGYTKITSDIPIKFSYATDYETINEDYIKNVRASFGEKYGPINSIVLSRSAESDNIYIQDEESIEENGLCEVKIKDNQILNDNNRNEFLDDLLDYLGGIEYYTNDYESIGITYLDLCDKYKVQIGDTKYDCIMFNDEVDIHDGLNEVIYTDKPETSVTDYKKASTTDKLQRQTNLIVDKQNQRIEAIVSDSEDSFASINVELGKISSQVQGYDVTIDELGNEIQTLRSSYTEQTPTMISDWFDTNLKSIVDDLQNTTSGNDEEIRKIKAYIRRGVITDPQSPYYNQAYIELGDETNQTTLRILQNRIQFLTNGQETAFISNNQLYINESTILTKEKVGHWVTTEDEDGLLNTYWED